MAIYGCGNLNTITIIIAFIILMYEYTHDHTRLQTNDRKPFLQHKEHVIHISVSLVEY